MLIQRKSGRKRFSEKFGTSGRGTIHGHRRTEFASRSFLSALSPIAFESYGFVSIAVLRDGYNEDSLILRLLCKVSEVNKSGSPLILRPATNRVRIASYSIDVAPEIAQSCTETLAEVGMVRVPQYAADSESTANALGITPATQNTMNQQNLSSFIWSVADLPRGDYKQSDYGMVILPFTVLRRLDCVLEATKELC